MFEIVKRVRQLLNQDWSMFDENERQRADNLLEAALSELESVIVKTDMYDALQQIVEEDKLDLAMPIPIMFRIYQRLVEVSTDKHGCLLDFAEYLSLFGPDWDTERQQIIDYVNAQQIAEAIRVARSVDYGKWV